MRKYDTRPRRIKLGVFKTNMAPCVGDGTIGRWWKGAMKSKETVGEGKWGKLPLGENGEMEIMERRRTSALN